jgi:hypothetical protein
MAEHLQYSVHAQQLSDADSDDAMVDSLDAAMGVIR